MSWDSFRQQLPKGYSSQDLELIGQAHQFAEKAHDGVPRASGEPYMVHPEAVALILADLRLDAPTLAAALLHDVAEDTDHKIPKLAELFGPEIAALVDGVTKLVQIDKTANVPTDRRDPKMESLRKMFLAMANDIRVMLIKLADRLHNMRTIGYLSPEKQRRISRETLDVYVSLANLLGIFRIKWELEDLAFRCLEPETYAQIGKALDQHQLKGDALIARVIETLRPELEKADIQAEISGRPKHIYSIWRKMKRKGVTQEEIYDQAGVRVITSTVGDCYVALGIVHRLWRPVPGEFDDYIASPKQNQYQSLHTAVIGPESRHLEIQIRTAEMHRVSEVGIAAHWRYKAEGRRDEVFEQRIAWLRSLIQWQEDQRSSTDEFMTAIREELKDRVFVFTPKGDVIDLPVGSTPIDFAYRVHTEVGHRCRGARVNNRQVGLDYKLQNGDRVEIITIKRGGPSRDWINANLNFTASARARNKIRQWFLQQDREENILAGREQLQRELIRLSMEDLTYEEVAKLFNYDRLDDFLADLGCGDISIVDVAEKVLQISKIEEAPKTVSQTLQAQEVPQQPALSGDGIFVEGAGNMLTHLSRCCNPMPPDDIIGFVTRGRGVTVHRRDCPNVFRLGGERLIRVDWGSNAPAIMRVKIRVLAWDRAGLLRDITQILDEEKINLEDASASTGGQENRALITATLKVRGAEQLSRVLLRIQRIPNVIEVRRQKG